MQSRRSPNNGDFAASSASTPPRSAVRPFAAGALEAAIFPPDTVYPTAEEIAETARRDGTAWWNSLPVGVQAERGRMAVKTLHLMRHAPAEEAIAAIRNILLSGKGPS